MNTCISSDQLILYHLDELDPGERAAAAAHLLACPTCRKQLQRLTAATALIDSRGNAVPVPDLTAKVMQRLAAQPPAGNRFTHWRPLASAAAVLALLIAGGLWYSRLGAVPVAPVRDTPMAVAPEPAPATSTTATVAPAAEAATILVSADEADELFDPEERELWRMLDETAAELDAAVADNGLTNGVPADAV